jgi:hypothetical protein
MGELEAFVLLSHGTSLVKRMVSSEGLYKLSETDLNKLQGVRRTCEAGYVRNDQLLKEVGLTMDDLAMLLGALTFHERHVRSSVEFSVPSEVDAA